MSWTADALLARLVSTRGSASCLFAKAVQLNRSNATCKSSQPTAHRLALRLLPGLRPGCAETSDCFVKQKQSCPQHHLSTKMHPVNSCPELLAASAEWVRPQDTFKSNTIWNIIWILFDSVMVGSARVNQSLKNFIYALLP